MEPNPKTLSQLFQLDHEGELWRPDEYRSIFQHQLHVDVSELASSEHSTDPAETNSTPISIDTLLMSQRPSPQDLVAVKQFAKSSGAAPDGPLPKPVAAVLYLLAIAKALQATETRITELDDDSLKTKLTWAAGQTWLDDHFRVMLRATARRLG
ncbi:hypothetical protein Mal15_26940 [Stieleria maiorica]|uniref:Uncharacterized protein n=1 Tax=Stieleria maiorica TaxID=2795974 RepID=A0A5B9MDQ9_9BACT|nr:hypothetical protein [Stieleria maiorica]QEF98639.1 hypothetical protein Mal15_26940 [Stieleria maiorica]